MLPSLSNMPLGEKGVFSTAATIPEKEVQKSVFLKIWSNSEYFWDQNIVEYVFMHRLASRRGSELATTWSYDGAKF